MEQGQPAAACRCVLLFVATLGRGVLQLVSKCVLMSTVACFVTEHPVAALRDVTTASWEASAQQTALAMLSLGPVGLADQLEGFPRPPKAGAAVRTHGTLA